jgi:signal peptidase I
MSSILRRLPLPHGFLPGRVYVVKGASMEPSFKDGTWLLVSRRSYLNRPPARGDVAVIYDPKDRGRSYVKRTVGLPGEEVRLHDGSCFINGDRLLEPYLGGLPASLGIGERLWRLSDNEYFFMGDNRARSTDSRDFGPVGPEHIVGRAWFRCWPLNRWGSIS